jgi:hypothetical protein
MSGNRRRVSNVVILALAFSLVAGTAAVNAQNVGRILTGGAIAVAVSMFGGEINNFVNTLTGYRDTNQEMSKVVPIISAGRGTHVGAVQVLGSRREVQRVKAVAQIEGEFSRARVRALIPVDTLNPTANPARVRGVGVSALVDLRL